MKKLLVILVGIIGSVAISATESADAIREKLLDPNGNYVLVAAHRADWRNFPENSLEAMESSIQMGVDIIEIDLQMTADSQLIIMHDRKLNRTTTGQGRIAEVTLDSVSRCRLRSATNEPTSYRIPTLREVMQLCKGRVLVNLDKADRYFDLVMPILIETGTTRQVIMKGRKPAAEVRQLYGKYLDDILYMPVMNMNDSTALPVFQDHLDNHWCAIELCFSSDDRYVKQASDIAKGKALIWINTMWDSLCAGHDDDKAYLESADAHYGYIIHTLGARIIQTDRAAFLIDYLQKQHLR